MDEQKALKEFQERIGYRFKDEKLLYEALSHSSFANENKKARNSNERLEFLGDSVLSIVVSDHIFEHYKHMPEGELTKMRAMLASEECPIHPNYKAALLKAGDSDTIVTGRTVGAPVRVLKNRMSREYVRQEKAGADKMELEKYTLGSLRRAVFEGDTVSGSLMAGQVAGMLHEVRPVADILADLWQGGRQRIAALNTEC